jgi:F0F1-type ATP synthase membrane subunit c/vacuolar-type H+-ATPase subunit K
MTINATPPGWADVLLRIVLRPGDFDSVSGDLLEEYRDSVHPSRGPQGADVWYVRQVLGFVWRSARLWAALFAAAFIARTAMDWLSPIADFHSRAVISTLGEVSILLVAGFWAALRSGWVVAGLVVGAATAVMAAPIKIVGAATILAVWHDPTTMEAIRGSGGLAEVFTLPLIMVLPGVVLGTIGGCLGVAAKRLRPA